MAEAHPRLAVGHRRSRGADAHHLGKVVGTWVFLVTSGRTDASTIYHLHLNPDQTFDCINLDLRGMLYGKDKPSTMQQFAKRVTFGQRFGGTWGLVSLADASKTSLQAVQSQDGLVNTETQFNDVAGVLELTYNAAVKSDASSKTSIREKGIMRGLGDEGADYLWRSVCCCK